MPNDALINHVLSSMESVSPSERLILKLAAALLKQLDPNYEIDQDTDGRIKLNNKEMDWLPGLFEVWNSIPRPKDWEIPERIAAVKREKAACLEIMDQTGMNYFDAWSEYRRRLKHES